MGIDYERHVDGKKFPLTGIGEFFVKKGGVEKAKNLLEKTLTKEKVKEETKEKVRNDLESVNGIMRKATISYINHTPILKKVMDLHPSPEIAPMPIPVEDWENMEKDIEERGIQVPLVINKKDQIICGINRWKIAKRLKLEEIPCYIANIESSEEIWQYSLRDNLKRRQLKKDERKRWTMELIRKLQEKIGKEMMAKPVVGRPKKGTKSVTSEVAKEAGVTKRTAQRYQAEEKNATDVAFPKKKPLWVSDDDKWSISKGKDLKRDATFHKEVAEKIEKRILGYMDSMTKGKRLQIKVTYQVEDEN